MATTHAIVIGGGITGVATAYELGKHGVHVTLLERDQLASMGSGRTMAGVRQSGRHVAELPIAREAIRRWEHLSEELGENLDYRQNGNLRLAFSAEQAEVIKQVVQDGIAADVPVEWLEYDAVHAIVPEITDAVVGASSCPTDGHADNHKTVDAYGKAIRRQGAEVITRAEVIRLIHDDKQVAGVETASGNYSADVVIVAAGIYTPQLLAPLGLNLPTMVIHCPVAQTYPTEAFHLTPVLGVAEGDFAGLQTIDGAVRFIGKSIPWMESGHHTDANTGVSVEQARNMMRKGMEVLPGLANLRIERMWGGLIDASPDGLPVLDTVPEYDGLIVGAGFTGHGFGTGPMNGEILANLAVHGDDARFDLTPFRLNRFTATPETHQPAEMLG